MYYTFNRNEYNKWYVDLPEWTGDHSELQMVCGADTMLDILSEGENSVRVAIKLDYVENATVKLTLKELTPEIGGGLYHGKIWPASEIDNIWLCGVTEFVFGHMPPVIYIVK